MDRREALGMFGALGAGVVAGSAAAADHEHSEGHAAGLPSPLNNLHAYFCGIHIAKSNPKFHVITRHYCGHRGDDMHQCMLFDAADKNPKLLGVEYIITDRLYRELPEEEKKYWHPHTYEVLAGGLIAPEMTPDEEMTFMKGLLTTWGKTWHTWPDPTSDLPLGEPLLMWALTGDHQSDAKVFARRDEQFGVSTAKISERRVEAFGLELPQVSSPKSVDQVGRQWTDRGEDKPTRRRR
jgi:hypothetical protein